MNDAIMGFLVDYAFPAFFWLFRSAIGLGIVLGLSWVVAEVFSRKWVAEGTVMPRDYEPPTLQTSDVPTFTGKGSGIGVATTGHAQRWNTLIMVDGHVYVFDCPTVFVKLKPGDVTRVQMKRNAVSGVSLDLVWDTPIKQAAK